MDIKKCKASSVMFHLLILCFAAVQLHAATGRLSLSTKSLEPLITDTALSAQNYPENGQAGWRSAGCSSEFGNVVMTIMAGVAGNLVGMYAGAFLGIVVPAGPFVGGIAGSACGSALGVYLAGSLGGRGGDFGPALLGSLLGEAAAVALAFIIPVRGESEFGFLTGFLILPPIGAALVFNSSRRSMSSRAGNGILNLAEGKLGLGVPDIQVQPSFVPGLKTKPELRFNVRVLSVEL